MPFLGRRFTFSSLHSHPPWQCKITCLTLLYLPFTSFPFSGKILLHVSPGLHEALSLRAEAVGKSLNTIASEALRAGLVAT